MELDKGQRRTLIALAASVAWADGVVEEEERAFVRGMAERFAGDSLAPGEVERWLEKGPPEVEISSLPPEIGEMFFYEAMRLVEADGEITDLELEMLNDIMSRVFRERPGGISLGKISLVKRRV